MLLTSARAAALAEQLTQAAGELIALLDSIDDEQWLSVRTVGKWSPARTPSTLPMAPS